MKIKLLILILLDEPKTFSWKPKRQRGNVKWYFHSRYPQRGARAVAYTKVRALSSKLLNVSLLGRKNCHWTEGNVHLQNFVLESSRILCSRTKNSVKDWKRSFEWDHTKLNTIILHCVRKHPEHDLYLQLLKINIWINKAKGLSAGKTSPLKVTILQ